MPSQHYFVGGRNVTNSVREYNASDDSLVHEYNIPEYAVESGKTDDIARSRDGSQVFIAASHEEGEGYFSRTTIYMYEEGEVQWEKTYDGTGQNTDSEIIYDEMEKVIYAELPNRNWSRQLLKLDADTGELLFTFNYDYGGGLEIGALELDETGVYLHMRAGNEEDNRGTKAPEIIKYDRDGWIQWINDTPIRTNSIAANGERVVVHTTDQQVLWMDAETGEFVNGYDTDFNNAAEDIEIDSDNNAIIGFNHHGIQNGPTIGYYTYYGTDNSADEEWVHDTSTGRSNSYGGIMFGYNEEYVYLGTNEETVKYNIGGYERDRFHPFDDTEYHSDVEELSFPRPQVDTPELEQVYATQTNTVNDTNTATTGDIAGVDPDPNHESYFVGGSGERKAYVIEYDAKDHFEIRRTEVDYDLGVVESTIEDSPDAPEIRIYSPDPETIHAIDRNEDGTELYVMSSADDAEGGSDTFIRKFDQHGTMQWSFVADGSGGSIAYNESRDVLIALLPDASHKDKVVKISPSNGNVTGTISRSQGSSLAINSDTIFVGYEPIGAPPVIRYIDYDGNNYRNKQGNIDIGSIDANDDHITYVNTSFGSVDIFPIEDGSYENSLVRMSYAPLGRGGQGLSIDSESNVIMASGTAVKYFDYSSETSEVITNNEGDGIVSFEFGRDEDYIHTISRDLSRMYTIDGNLQVTTTPLHDQYRSGTLTSVDYPRPQVSKQGIEQIRATKAASTWELTEVTGGSTTRVWADRLDITISMTSESGLPVNIADKNDIAVDMNTAFPDFVPLNPATKLFTRAGMNTADAVNRGDLLGGRQFGATTSPTTALVSRLNLDVDQAFGVGFVNGGSVGDYSVTSTGLDVVATENSAFVPIVLDANTISATSVPTAGELSKLSIESVDISSVATVESAEMRVPTSSKGSIVQVDTIVLAADTEDIPYARSPGYVRVKTTVSEGSTKQLIGMEYGESSDLRVAEDDN